MNKPKFDPTKTYRLVRVEWIDSVSTKGGPWLHLEDVVAKTDMLCVSVGWIVFQDDVSIVLVAHFTSHKQVCGDFRIPSRAILEIRDIATVAPVFVEKPGPTDDQPLLCPYCSKHHWRDVKCAPPTFQPSAVIVPDSNGGPPVPVGRPEPSSLVCGFCGEAHPPVAICFEVSQDHPPKWWCPVCGLHAAKAACPNTTYFCSSCGVRHENTRHSVPDLKSRETPSIGEGDEILF